MHDIVDEGRRDEYHKRLDHLLNALDQNWIISFLGHIALGYLFAMVRLFTELLLLPGYIWAFFVALRMGWMGRKAI